MSERDAELQRLRASLSFCFFRMGSAASPGSAGDRSDYTHRPRLSAGACRGGTVMGRALLEDDTEPRTGGQTEAVGNVSGSSGGRGAPRPTRAQHRWEPIPPLGGTGGQVPRALGQGGGCGYGASAKGIWREGGGRDPPPHRPPSELPPAFCWGINQSRNGWAGGSRSADAKVGQSGDGERGQERAWGLR